MINYGDKIDNLLLTANKPQEEFLQPGDGPLDDYLRKSEILDAMSDWIKQLAKASGSILGRRVSFQVADGQAYYVVTHVIKNLAYVRWVNYDECYIDDRLGISGTLDLEYVRKSVQWEDQMDEARKVST